MGVESGRGFDIYIILINITYTACRPFEKYVFIKEYIHTDIHIFQLILNLHMHKLIGF